MFFRNLKATYGLTLPAVSVLCCLILAGCSDQGTVDTDKVTLEPSKVTISPGEKPVQVVATWTPVKEGGTFDRWRIVGDADIYTLKPENITKSQTTITVEAVSELPAIEELRRSRGTLSRSALIGAVVERGADKTNPGEWLSISVIAPALEITVPQKPTRNPIDAQTYEISASIFVEVIGNPKLIDYNLELEFTSGRWYSCTSGSDCSPRPFANTPTLTMKPAGPGKSGNFAFKQIVKATPPDTMGRIEWNVRIVGTSPDNKKIESEITTIRF